MPEIEFTCEKCSLAIDPTDGELFITAEQVEIADQRVAATQQALAANGGSLSFQNQMALPPAGQWQAMHNHCADELDLTAVYGIPLRRLNTYQHLVAWLVHLKEKRWQEGSNFMSIVSSFGRELPS